MHKGVVVFWIFIVTIPLAFSISIKELISRYTFSTTTAQMNVTNHTDFMVDKDNNEANDTLVFELTTNNTAGTFVFVINLFDKDSTSVNETNKTLSFGINKINITFSSHLLDQNQFNYSIKIYNASRSLKYRKDKILTNFYSNYEEGFRILAVNDSRINKTLRVNVSANSPDNKTHVTTLFLSYSNSIIFSKASKKYKVGINYLIFNFDNETIKNTHYIGNFNISSIKIGTKTIKTNFTTAFYDFKDFGVTSYIYNFTDNGTDTDNNGKFDFLEINTSTQILKTDDYTLAISLYDLFDNLVEIKNLSIYLNVGKNIVPVKINGSKIYDKKINGPYMLKSVELYDSIALVDGIKNAYTTSSYNFNDFDKPDLPDLKVNISASSLHRYGIGNVTINITIKNIGYKHAFDVFADIFDNKTLSISNKSSALAPNSQILYQFNFTDFSDFEINAIADLNDFVEELNESNNAEKASIKLNKHPILSSVNNLTLNETDKISINLSAVDPNGDNLSFSINLSKFSNESNKFQWNTTVTDSGKYFLMATASDGYLNDSKIFIVTVLDLQEKDTDNDGIDDDIDELIGNESHVNTSTLNLGILIGNSRNLSKRFNGKMNVRFMDGNFTIADFDFNFSRYKLNLTNITINKQGINATGSLFAKGLKMPEGVTKTLYVDKVNASINGLCIKEEEILSINDISDNCNSNNEFKIECDGTAQNPYTCTYNSTSNKYKIEGLKHSGIMQISYAKPLSESTSTTTSSGTSSSGGGGGIFCASDWQCTQWTGCVDGFQNRKCSDISQCAFPANKPSETQQCEIFESGLVNVIKQIEYARKTISRVTQKTQTSGITGQAIKEQYQKNSGILIVFIEIFVFVGSYLLIKSKFFK
ncbi:hypothetical protein HYX02_05720 [Candidatus Woesearchaeota archaeon]|nr:hypothetical protein [Candidatus Woesearchaeota archaeon]